MSITLSDGTTSVSLNPDLYWSDENYSPVLQSTETTLTGALVVQAGARVSGRPITLEPEDNSSGWMARSVIEQMRNWAAVPLKQLTLTLRGASRTVIFRHQDGALEFAPVQHMRDVEIGDFYVCTIRLMEI